MASSTIKLFGSLPQRQRDYNKQVKEAFEKYDSFEQIKDMPELSDLDRQFKLDLAIAFKHSEYILAVLQSGEPLTTERVIQKCSWLYDDEFSTIIEPDYLDKHIFNSMSMKMIGKLLSEISSRVKNKSRLNSFYEYCKSNCVNKNAVIRKCNHLYEHSHKKYLDLLEKYEDALTACACNLSRKMTKIILSKHHRRIQKKPSLYIKILNSTILAKSITHLALVTENVHLETYSGRDLVVYGIFQLSDESTKIKFLENYAPQKPSNEEEPNTLNTQKAIIRFSTYSPPKQLFHLMMYITDDVAVGEGLSKHNTARRARESPRCCDISV
ncbi:uncharacterized protein LOC114359286 [Ostrinia furnacalis]|uniref:uncharacterized protein LOC114359286 n=1 Tax=Ostrinia furnacalis TaxID=93504 RepID=UPI00103F628F|nr:uncharacterized protein LOC114359286 [Ostrinia furnacalis]